MQLENAQGRLASARSPWWYVPTLYFQQGLPVIVIQQVSVILYKNLGLANDQIALWTSLIAWPWILKVLWAPLVDLHGTRRKWVLWSQLGIVAGLLLSALAIGTDAFLPLSLAVFFFTALLSATHDVALDGYYLIALKPDKQAFFAGICSTAFRMAMIFGSGAMVMLAGTLEKGGMPVVRGWQWTLGLSGALYGVLMLYAWVSMPRVAQDVPAAREAGSGASPFREAIVSFFTQPGIIPICLFLLFYRFAESMLTKLAGLFLLDPVSAGGLGLSTIQVGMIQGNVGMISLTAGGLLGGFAIARYGFRRCLWPMALILHLPNLLYLWLAHAKPALPAVYAVVAIEQFGYGFGLASYMVFTMLISQRNRYQTTHYAITMGLMALGAMLAGISSGYLQTAFGYTGFFWAVCVATLPAFFLLRYIPKEFSLEASPAKPADREVAPEPLEIV